LFLDVEESEEEVSEDVREEMAFVLRLFDLLDLGGAGLVHTSELCGALCFLLPLEAADKIERIFTHFSSAVAEGEDVSDFLQCYRSMLAVLLAATGYT
jgi:hypothetical protein